MFKSKKTTAPKAPSKAPFLDLNMMGLGDDGSGDDDDDSLEAELANILGGNASKPKTRKKAAAVDLNTIHLMASQALKDDDENMDDDGDFGEDLEAELAAIVDNDNDDGADMSSPDVSEEKSAPVSSNALVQVIQDRLINYKEAIDVARLANESSRIRRFERSIKVLQEQLQKAQKGISVPQEEIPPPVAVSKKKSENSQSQPVQPASGGVPAPSSAPEVPRRISSKSAVLEPEKPKPVSVSTKPDSEEELIKPKLPPRPMVLPQIPNTRPAAVGVSEDSTAATLRERRDQYKMAAIQARRGNRVDLAVQYMRAMKQFEAVLSAYEKGEPVDLSKMPPPLPPASSQPAGSLQPPAARAPEPIPSSKETQPVAANSFIDENVEDDPALFGAPTEKPKSLLDALEQRLNKYERTREEALLEDNSSKARRLGRIVAQYKDAIKCHKAGKPFDYAELPAPPGFGELPLPGSGGEPGALKASPRPPAPAAPQPQKLPAPSAPPPRPQRSPQAGASQQPTAGSSTANTTPPKPGMKRTVSTTMERQLEFLYERQRLFREAALESKKRGDIEQAKEYLRIFKGLEPMIEATKSGLPINVSSIPIPPQLQKDFEIVSHEDCLPDPPAGGAGAAGTVDDVNEMYRTLERELVTQHEMCVNNKDHFIKLGDVASATKFEKLAHDTNRDVTVIRGMWKRGDALPKFHYETRVFTIVRANHDLTDEDMEVNIVRAINLPGKANELDTYVRVEVPYPSDATQSNRTRTIRDTNNPEYGESLKFSIHRKARTFARFIKRYPVKCEIWSKRGFLRSDALIGTAQVKLVDLENVCIIHDSFEIVDEKRRATGAKLEVKIRIREPVVAKQVEEIRERWLVIAS